MSLKQETIFPPKTISPAQAGRTPYLLGRKCSRPILMWLREGSKAVHKRLPFPMDSTWAKSWYGRGGGLSMSGQTFHLQKIFISISASCLSFLILASFSNTAVKENSHRLALIPAHPGSWLRRQGQRPFSSASRYKILMEQLWLVLFGWHAHLWINQHGQEHGALWFAGPGSQAHSWRRRRVLRSALALSVVTLKWRSSSSPVERHVPACQNKMPTMLGNLTLIQVRINSANFKIKRYPYQAEH